MLVAFLPTDVFFATLKAIKPFHKELSCKNIVLDSCCSRVHQLYVSLPVHKTTSLLQITRISRFCVIHRQLFIALNVGIHLKYRNIFIRNAVRECVESYADLRYFVQRYR